MKDLNEKDLNKKRMKDLNGKDPTKRGKKVALTEAERFRWSWNKRQEFLMKKAKNRSSAGRSRHVGGEAKKKIASDEGSGGGPSFPPAVRADALFKAASTMFASASPSPLRKKPRRKNPNRTTKETFKLSLVRAPGL